MRVIWNGICDPTLHMIAIALLLAGMGSFLDRKGLSSVESGPLKRCRICVRYHDYGDLQCVYRHHIVASRNPTE